jgi:hypothetical protein
MAFGIKESKPSEKTRFAARDCAPPPLLDITMTAVRRPEILKRTLNSFFKNLYSMAYDKCRIIVNIDPIGDSIASFTMCDIISAYAPRYIISLPLESSFPRAFKWTWEQVTAPWVLHLEDDWELLEPVDLASMIDMMERHKNLASLRLPFFDSTAKSMKNWNLQFPWNGEYFACPIELRQQAGFAGHPSLLRGEFVRNCVPLLDDTINPEKQFHSGNAPLVTEVLNWEYGVWGKPNSKKVLADIGSAWRTENKFQKAGSKAFFTQWEKIK